MKKNFSDKDSIKGRFYKINKKIVFFVILVLLIEISGHGIFASLLRFLSSMN
tara:strand:- start:163 stop:318 length:156 start_codon:yes stop_codon:yes gene_type:complete